MGNNRHFQACHKCVAPKRHLGCHATCKEYADEKAEFEEVKERLAKEQAVSACVHEAVARTCRYHGVKKMEAMK